MMFTWSISSMIVIVIVKFSIDSYASPNKDEELNLNDVCEVLLDHNIQKL